MLKKYILTIAIMFLTASLVFPGGNNFLKDNNIQIETRLHYGFLLSHHLELDKFNAHFPAFEISLQKATFGTHRWEKKYDYPIVGVSFWASTVGGFEEIGNAYALFPFINFPLFRNKKSTVNFRIGLGLGYMENKFDNKTNYKNFAIGSHLNIAANLQFEYRRKISKRLFVGGGLTLTHFSNGSTKTPNYGLNILTGNISFTYFLSSPKQYGGQMVLPELFPFEFDGRKMLEVNFSFAIANKDMSQELGKRFMVYAAYANIMKRVSYKSKFGLGIDVTADLSDKYTLDLRTDSLEYFTGSYVKTGISAAYELMISRVSILFNLGLYISGKERSRGDSYQRLSFKYLINKNLFANVVLNSNAGKADYIGIGAGYRFDFIYKRDIKH